MFIRPLSWGVMFLFAYGSLMLAQDNGEADSIVGVVVGLPAGAADIIVCLCDADTGSPVSKKDYKPIWNGTDNSKDLSHVALAISDPRGQFRFDNVPKGKFRLIAQKWTGPFKGIFAEHGTAVQLMGVANDIVVPRPNNPEAVRVVIQPAGPRSIQFDQAVPNNDTIVLLSTSPPEFDPVLGPSALGSAFCKNIIGVNRMPLGKTTFINAPRSKLYAFFAAPDNFPGFAVAEIGTAERQLTRVPRTPFVAAWSDGRKTPPPKLAELRDLMARHSLTASELLGLPQPSNANYQEYEKRMKILRTDLARNVKLPEGQVARVGDILAVYSYERLKR